MCRYACSCVCVHVEAGLWTDKSARVCVAVGGVGVVARGVRRHMWRTEVSTRCLSQSLSTLVIFETESRIKPKAWGFVAMANSRDFCLCTGTAGMWRWAQPLQEC